MIRTILSTVFFLITATAYAQCNCEKINRDDGAQITQCQPSLIAYDNSSQIALALASNGVDDFVTVTIRFKSSATKMKGDLSIRTNNNDLVSLQLVNSQLAYIGGSEVSQGIFVGDNSDMRKLSDSEIKTLTYKLTNDLLRTYQAKKSPDILVKQLKCL